MPTLYLMCGLPGAGKTTLAKRLEQEKQALRLSPDEWIAPFLSEGADQEEIDQFRPPVEAVQWELAKRLFALGVSVISERGFWRKEERLDCATQAKAMGVAVELYVLDVAKEELWNRLSKRSENPSLGMFRVSREHLDLYSSWFEPPQPDEFDHYDSVYIVNQSKQFA